MASAVFRLMGVDLNPSKAIGIALRSVYGLGPAKASELCGRFGINPQTKLADLRYALPALSQHLEASQKSKAQMFRELSDNIGMKIKLHTYEGQRHQYALPLNGQKNINAKTQRKLGMARAKLLNFPLAKPKSKPTR